MGSAVGGRDVCRRRLPSGGQFPQNACRAGRRIRKGEDDPRGRPPWETGGTGLLLQLLLHGGIHAEAQGVQTDEARSILMIIVAAFKGGEIFGEE